MNLPLGGDGSIAWKSNDGKILSDHVVESQIETYRKNDAIGIAVRMYPPHKYPTQESKYPRGILTFMKNGKIVYEKTVTKHDHYCIAFSLFNFASVKVNYRKSEMKYLPNDF